MVILEILSVNLCVRLRKEGGGTNGIAGATLLLKRAEASGRVYLYELSRIQKRSSEPRSTGLGLVPRHPQTLQTASLAAECPALALAT